MFQDKKGPRETGGLFIGLAGEKHSESLCFSLYIFLWVGNVIIDFTPGASRTGLMLRFPRDWNHET
jgi:hypothetical protein